MRAEVRLRITVSMLERLLQQALAQGAVFSRVSRSGRRSVIVDCDEASADILLAMCKRYRLDCKILRRRGKRMLRARFISRLSLTAGMALCIALCCVFLSRIWLIDIQFTGPSAHLGQEKAIRRCLDGMEIAVGMRSDALDAGLLQKQLMAETGNYSHIGIRKQGIRLLVEAAPEVPAPEIYEIGIARDLVAAMDGVVASINVKSGQACVNVGDTVRRGQLLIRGQEAKSKEETAAVSALGEVHVRSWYEGGAEGTLSEERLQRTGRTSVSRRLRLMDWSLPLTDGRQFAQSESETRILPMVGLYLPLEMAEETIHEIRMETVSVDQNALMQRLIPIAQAQAKAELSLNGPAAYEITDYWEEFTIENNILRVRAVYEITADIAVTRDALIEEVQQTWKPADK